VAIFRNSSRQLRDALIATLANQYDQNPGKDITNMKMNSKAANFWSGRISNSRAGFAAFALLGAISVVASGCSGASNPVVVVPPAPVITSFTATSNSVNTGGSTTLNWVVANTSEPVQISGIGGVTGNPYPVTVGSSSSVKVSPVETTTYTLTAGGAGGGAIATLTITVNGVAVATSCTPAGTTYTVGSGTTVVKVASADTFTSSLLFWLNNYFYSSNTNANFAADSAAYTMEVCSDSTGNLESAIAGATYLPNIFFAADTSVETASYAKLQMEYAQGYPILLGYTSASGKAKTISAITDLVGGLSGTHADISATIAKNQLSAYTLGSLITSGAPGSLIANPIKAPYGAAAVNILNAMNSAYTVTYTSGGITAYPIWLQNPTTYTSDTAAYNSIGTSSGAPTGFATFSSICTAPPTGATWVRFTGTDVLNAQAVADLEVDPGGGTEIFNLINNEMNDSNNTWLNFITTDYGNGSCYAGI
jgi:hypothetical protein